MGAEGVLSLINLWIWAAKNKPSGQLSNLDSEDIEIASKWGGEFGTFYKTLIDLSLLDKDDHDMCSVHNWAKHNAYACHADARSAKAKKAAETRWKNNDAKGCSEHIEALPVARESIAPSPSPSPSPDPLPDTSDSTESEDGVKAPSCPHIDIIELHNELLPELKGVMQSLWNGARKTNLTNRWKESPKHQALEFWQWFFRVVRKNPHWMGENSRGWKADFGWLLKRENFNKVIEFGIDQQKRTNR